MAAVEIVAISLYLFDSVLDSVCHAVADLTLAEFLLRISAPELKTFGVSPDDSQIINVKQAQGCPYMVERMYARVS